MGGVGGRDLSQEARFIFWNISFPIVAQQFKKMNCRAIEFELNFSSPTTVSTFLNSSGFISCNSVFTWNLV